MAQHGVSEAVSITFEDSTTNLSLLVSRYDRYGRFPFLPLSVVHLAYPGHDGRYRSVSLPLAGGVPRSQASATQNTYRRQEEVEGRCALEQLEY